MGKSKSVMLCYETKPSVDDVLRLGIKLTEARDKINLSYSGKAKCRVGHSDNISFGVLIEETQLGNLRDVVKDYFSLVDLSSYPLSHLQFGSDFDSVEEIIQENGKRLERKFKSVFLGKYVVDAK